MVMLSGESVDASLGSMAGLSPKHDVAQRRRTQSKSPRPSGVSFTAKRISHTC
ncbi:predicted protein [Plenodomus lingam JN3]|uniref:Uncharacterized protein n=1 Tax=Leptosphaeria maculans (strain JN3 / isolate v23.1.3 / race Av1-4-5-6-7-8) TaxID=985895 RepID=E5A6T0_LEPMJ|nr:predicted protein [Plenodomus lingam JN3]CBX99325.1 predicted protein [Plenodomus lingam JN3]